MSTRLLRVFVLTFVMLSSQPVVADDDVALTQLVRILRDQGVLDEDQYQDLSAKAADREQRWYDRINLAGDFRARYERFEFDHDKRDRARARYRARLDLAANINSRADVFFRFASGELDNRSANETFGGNDDFAKDALEISRAYAAISPFERGALPEVDGSWWFQMGRVPNPFRSKDYGKDFMLWDGDVNLEGIQSLIELALTDDVEVYANSGFYIVDEESKAEDPQMMAGQLGGSIQLAEHVQLGARSSFYNFSQLDSAFIERGVLSDKPDMGVTDGGGNLYGALTGSVDGGDLNIVEAGGFLHVTCLDDWPIRIYGDYSTNLSAENDFGRGQQDDAWGIGAEIGDKKRYVKLGAGFWHVEANAFPAMFIDSDLFDGTANREGWIAQLSRQILENTDVNVTAFISDPIERGFPFDDEMLGGESTLGADRVRLQFDVVYSFK